MDYDTFMELVKKRRSIRSFKPDPIPDDYIEKIIDAARYAPSGANSQPWEFVVVKKKELKDAIVKLISETTVLAHRMELTRMEKERFPSFIKPPQHPPSYADAPVFIILCGDTRTKNAYPLSAILNHADSIFTSSLASAFLHMHLAVTTFGLGAQWVTATGNPYEQSLIKDLLGIPNEMIIYDMMVLGYPKSGPRIGKQIRAMEEMIHYDQFDMSKFRSDEEVKDFIHPLRWKKNESD
ncbi:MAG: nitroreductase family protein [Deltaproteobacteria bacterium]|nr:nitroreductase family protein [Deltaproteobacteria bacterium]